MTPFLVRWMLISLLVGVVAGIASIVAHGRERTSWVVVAVLAVWLLTFWRGQMRRTRVTYRITSRSVTVQTGRIVRRRREAGLHAIADVRVRQTLMQRALGVGTVHFATAADAGYDLRFRGVDDPGRVLRAVDRALDDGVAGGEAPVFDPLQARSRSYLT